MLLYALQALRQRWLHNCPPTLLQRPAPALQYAVTHVIWCLPLRLCIWSAAAGKTARPMNGARMAGDTGCCSHTKTATTSIATLDST